ncbi:MAG: GC-type dockerin domain-anchored protein [Planctomycetota bacterium]
MTSRSMNRATRAAALALAAGSVGTATAQDTGVFLQIFENQWQFMERRAADIFAAGYQSVWLPPPSKAADAFSVGYDTFDRFDLGRPPLSDNSSGRARTAYGTEKTYKAMVQLLHRAGIQVYSDAVLNHNSGRTTSNAFFEAGGWPGFHVPVEGRDKFGTDDWGDFHEGVGQFTYLQSENPGAPNYDLFRGDLVALVDINQFDSNDFIRQPTNPVDPANIPAGTVRNQADAANARFYPDVSLPPVVFTNTATNNKPSSQLVTRYPFNLADPMAGDPVRENPGEYLARWGQWMMEVIGIDGFRLDASKHTFPQFWDELWDAGVFRTRTLANGAKINPLTFGENTTGNGDILANFFREDSVANRDSLDLAGAGSLRNLVGSNGFGNWSDVLNAHLDQSDNGLQDGSAGIMHAYSHDNGTVGNGSSLPAIPTERQVGLFAHAYLMTRPGRVLVYHNARGVPRSFGFFPREGAPQALGLDPNTQQPDDSITELVGINRSHAYGFYFPLVLEGDVFIYERASNDRASLLVGLNDSYANGSIQSRTVTTRFAQGTRLHELTGNAADPDVDPTDVIPEIITVGAGGQVTLQVPSNANGGADHNHGYVIYGPLAPDSTLTIVGASGTIPPDPFTFPDFAQRLTSSQIVTGDQFTIRLETAPGDPLAFDPENNTGAWTDDNALFRINDGGEDWNGSGAPDFGPFSAIIPFFENFTDTKTPGSTQGNREGLYEQIVDATRLPEGYNFVRTIAFLQRVGPPAILDEQRVSVYVDRLEPDLELVVPDLSVDLQPELQLFNTDNTIDTLHTFLNLPDGSDPVALTNAFNRRGLYDRDEYRFIFDEPFQPGENTVTVVAFELSGRASVQEITVIAPGECPIDYADPIGTISQADVAAFVDLFFANDPAADLAEPFGVISQADVAEFVDLFFGPCP